MKHVFVISSLSLSLSLSLHSPSLPPSLPLPSQSSPECEDAVLKMVVARFAYTPQYDDELGFGAGDHIDVTVDSTSTLHRTTHCVDLYGPGNLAR